MELGYTPKTDFEKKVLDMQVIKEALEQYLEHTKNAPKERDWPIRFDYYSPSRYFYPRYKSIRAPLREFPVFLDNSIELPEGIFIIPLQSEELRALAYPMRSPYSKDYVYGIPAAEIDKLHRLYADWITYTQSIEQNAAITEEDLVALEYQIEDLHLTDIAVSFENLLTTIQLDGHESPTSQFLGSMDTYLQLQFHASSEAAVQRLNALVSYANSVARKYRDGIFGGFLKFRNPLAQLFGVENILVESLQISTIENHPGHYDITMTVVDFQTTQRRQSLMDFIQGGDGMEEVTPNNAAVDFATSQVLKQLPNLSYILIWSFQRKTNLMLS